VIDYRKAYVALKAIHTTFKEQFFTEKLYHNILAGGYLTYSKSLYTTFERLFIDGLVNSTYLIVQLLANIFKFFQIGRLNWYVLSLGAGLTMIVFILLVITIRGGL